jgi:Ca2+-transporting ATPase
MLLLAVYAVARAWLPADTGRDGMARALTFVVLVLANLGLIHANRAWGRTALLGNAESNPQFGWIAAGTLVVLGVVLGVPVVSQLFAFVTPPPVMLLAAVGVAVLSVGWFEVVKRVQGRRARSAV